MHAVRCTGQQRGFRVGKVVFRYDLWTPVEEVTDEHRIDGMLDIIKDITGPDDPRLFPFALLTEDDCPPLTMEQIGERLQNIEAEKQALGAKVERMESERMAQEAQAKAAQAQIERLQETDAQQKKQIADLLKRFADLEAAAKAVSKAEPAPETTPKAQASPAGA